MSDVIRYQSRLGPKWMLELKTSNSCPVPWMPCSIKAGEEVNKTADLTLANFFLLFP